MNNIIEPCCAERQLGILLREARSNAVLFQTNGDVTLEHFMKAIMLLAGSVRPRTMTLAVPDFTCDMMRVVGRYLSLEWIKTLRLMTTARLTQESLQQLADYVGCNVKALLERVELAADDNIPDELLAFSGVDGVVVIQGRIPDKVTPGLLLYSGIKGKADSVGIRSVMDVWNACFRAREYEADGTNGEDNGNNGRQKKRSRTAKKEENDEPTDEMAGVPQTEESAEAAKEAAADVDMAGESV